MLLKSAATLLALVSAALAQGGICGSQAKGALCPDKQASRFINDGPPPPPAGPKAPTIDTSKLFKPPAGTFDNNTAASTLQLPPAITIPLSQLPEHINPYLYTHVNYAFVFMAENYTVIPHEYDDEDLSLRMNRWIKKLNPSCTTSYSYTGGIDYTPFFSRMASSAASRKVFIDSAIAWARKLEFDGIDIDWEFVGDPQRGGSSSDKANFNSLCAYSPFRLTQNDISTVFGRVQELRAAAKTEAGKSGKKELILTMAAPAGPDHVSAIDPKTIAASIDWFNFYGNWDSVVENQAPILDQRLPNWSFSAAIDIYLKLGVPSKQLVAGLPLYGRVWTLTDPKQTTPGSPGGPGIAGRCTAQKGYLSYAEIQEIAASQNNRGINFVPGNGSKMDIISKKGLGGAMVWAIDQDTKDFNLTKTLINTFRTCPSDNEWPATLAGQSAEVECPHAPGFSETRQCGSDGKWGAPSNMDCLVNGASQAQFLMARDVCIQGK
ncbi:Endochitinase 1 [Ceratobasidium sp. 414]|nr:Endochitinase 1 [Ceratobasidium sp. 414]